MRWKKIELPDNIEQIGMYAFEDCTALKSVKLPARLTDIDQAVFAGCESLENIVIPEGVTSIKYRAFDGCDNLQYAIIPASVTSIEDGAFETGGETGICSFTVRREPVQKATQKKMIFLMRMETQRRNGRRSQRMTLKKCMEMSHFIFRQLQTEMES